MLRPSTADIVIYRKRLFAELGEDCGAAVPSAQDVGTHEGRRDARTTILAESPENRWPSRNWCIMKRLLWLACVSLAVPSLLSAQESKEGGGKKQITNSIGMKLVFISAGEFKMGNTHTGEEEATTFQTYGIPLKPDSFKNEFPRHRVRITRPFYLGTYPVTRGQFRQFVNVAKSPVDDPTGPDSGSYRVDRGGCWLTGPDRARSAFRLSAGFVVRASRLPPCVLTSLAAGTAAPQLAPSSAESPHSVTEA